jgi:hypothetical protein
LLGWYVLFTGFSPLHARLARLIRDPFPPVNATLWRVFGGRLLRGVEV